MPIRAGTQKIKTVINTRLNQNKDVTINQGLKYHVMVFGLYPDSNGKLMEGFMYDYKDYSGMVELMASKVLIMFYFLTRVLVT